MKKLIVLGFAVLVATNPLIQAGETARGSVVVIVTGIKSGEGALRIALANSKTDFADNVDPHRGAIVPLKGASTSRHVFRDLQPGEYAVKVFQDKNANDDLDRNALGLPAEPYGFSNNATAIMSPPKWEKAKFTVGTSAVTQTIKLR